MVRLRRRQRRILLLAALGLTAAMLRQCAQGSVWWNPLAEPPTSAASSDGTAEVAAAFRAGRSGVWVEAAGVVVRQLPDDRRGASHQRFILRLDNDQTLLVAHNIDIAPRVPLAVGDRVALRGEYEWNERGGVVHWTHHDPDSGARRGWIRHRGRDYE